MRASRLLSLLLLLQTRGRLTAQELAAELDVSVRTVYRDIDSLGAAGVPIYAERGPVGGYQLLDGYRTRLTGLTGDEAASLALAGLPGPAAELGLGAVLAAAQLKLQAALPAELRERAERVQQCFLLDAPGWFRDGEETPHLAAAADAVWQQRPVEIAYRRWDNSDSRATVEPLGLVLKAGIWYLVARADRPRTYRVARIAELTTLPGHFARDGDFDLGDFWRVWSERFEAGMYKAEAVVRFSPHGWRRRFLLGPLPTRAVEASAAPPDAEGWVRATLPIESLDHAETELLRFGPEAEVLEPPELRERLAAAARAMARRYRPAP